MQTLTPFVRTSRSKPCYSASVSSNSRHLTVQLESRGRLAGILLARSRPASAPAIRNVAIRLRFRLTARGSSSTRVLCSAGRNGGCQTSAGSSGEPTLEIVLHRPYPAIQTLDPYRRDRYK